MAKILTFFNHKGGVGKTTLSYNVAWNLSSKGKRILMIDADAQCNLTEISVDNSYLYSDEQQNPFDYDQDFFLQNNIYEYLLHYIQPIANKPLPEIKTFNKKENLEFLTGSIRFAELEETIALSIAGINVLRHVPVSTYNALQELGESFDYILVDLSPALSATNQLLLMLSDYFVVPVNPSIFSKQALINLNEIFRNWNRNLSGFEIFSRKVKGLPKLLGIVCQNYRSFSRKDEENTRSAQRFGERMDEINSRAVELANDLNSFGMALTPSEFKDIFVNSEPYRIANIPDYNQLAVVSESEKIPVTGLDSKTLNKYEINTLPYRQKIDDFNKECDNIVNGLLKILEKY
ncbi:MAG: AAA family ATPase [Defluviitaleaceae bacterium]|nr:AAA family ATPase [Defluviitaleaceae bacterium]